MALSAFTGRALIIGLAYTLIWEGVLAGLLEPSIVSLIGGTFLLGTLGAIFLGWIAFWPALASAVLWTLLIRRLFPVADQP